MKALGRLGATGSFTARFWLEEIGPDRFFTYLAKTAAAALIDDHVLFASWSKHTDADRFIQI